MCAPVFVCECAHMCLQNVAGFRSPIPLLWEKREARIKKKMSGSNPLKLRTVFVRVNLFITEISIEMIPVTDSPRISLMADTQNVYVYRTCEGSRKGQQCDKEQGSRKGGGGVRRLWEIIGEVRLGSIKARTRKLEEMLKRDKICKKTEKKNKTLEDEFHCRNS